MAEVGYGITEIDFGQGCEMLPLPKLENNGRSSPDKNRVYSVYEIVTRFFGSNPEEELKTYIEYFPQDYISKLPVDDAKKARLISCSYKRTRTGICQPVDSTVVDFVYYGTLSVETVHQTSRICGMQFVLRYIMDLRPERQTIYGPLIIPDNKEWEDPWEYIDDFVADEYLMPYIGSDEYEDTALYMLANLFPEDLNGKVPKHITGEQMADKMGLQVELVRFAEQGIMGQYYYERQEVQLYDQAGKVNTRNVFPGTILIDAKNCDTPAKKNITICHECCHAFLDRWFFLLQMMTGNRQWAHYNRRTEKPSGYQKKGPVEWMEYQCEKLPAYLLMDKRSVERYARMWISANKGRKDPEFIRGMINKIAKEYEVSFSMAKYRLIELGYYEAEGIGCYINGGYVPDHGCAGKWPEGVIFAISTEDAADVMEDDPKFEDLLVGGKYCYVESHFCQYDDRYVVRAGGKLHMTEYGRNHIDECCLPFRRKRGVIKHAEFQLGVVCRKKKVPDSERYRIGYELAAEPGTELYARENTMLAEDGWDWGELLYKMPTRFEDSVKEIMAIRGFTLETLAFELGVDQRTVRRYLGGAKVALGKVVGICIALEVPVYISLKLIEQSGNALRQDKNDHMYREFLLQSGKLSVARCEDILAERKMSPLFRGEGRMIAV